MILLTLIPALLSIIYTVTVKFRTGNTRNIELVVLGGFVALCNVGSMYAFFNGIIVSWTLRCLQQVLSCMIVPIAYTYFSSQMGNKRFNSVAISLWMLMLLLLIPTTLFTLDGVMPEVATQALAPMTLHFFYEGSEVAHMHTADAVIMLQALLTMVRLIFIVRTMHRYRLTISGDVYYFLVWWSVAILFIIFTSSHTTDEFAQPAMQWAYFLSYSILVVWIFYLLSLDFDLHMRMLNVDDIGSEVEKPLGEDATNGADEEAADMETPVFADTVSADAVLSDACDREVQEVEAEIVPDIETFVRQSRMMADQVRMMMENRKYLDPTLSIDGMAHQLYTNRTYFCRMIKAEFNCTFSELLAQHRVEYGMHVLQRSDASIKDIAIQSGFGGERSFVRHFTQLYGVSPQKWRENNRREHCHEE